MNFVYCVTILFHISGLSNFKVQKAWTLGAKEAVILCKWTGAGASPEMQNKGFSESHPVSISNFEFLARESIHWLKDSSIASNG